MDSVKKIGKVLSIIARVIFRIALAGAIVCAVCAVVCAFFDSAFSVAGEYTFSLGGLDIELSPDYEFSLDLVRSRLVATLFIGAVECIFVAIIAKISERILASVRDEGPFTAGISQRIRTLAFVSLIGGAIVSVLDIIAEYIMIGMIDVRSLFVADSVAKISYNLDMDMSFVGVFLVLYMLSFVFRCGEELQQQSDETL